MGLKGGTRLRVQGFGFWVAATIIVEVVRREALNSTPAVWCLVGNGGGIESL